MGCLRRAGWVVGVPIVCVWCACACFCACTYPVHLTHVHSLLNCPAGRGQLFWFSAGTGSLYLIDASKRAADGVAAAIKEVYRLRPEPVYGSCVFSGRFLNDTRRVSSGEASRGYDAHRAGTRHSQLC